MNAPTRITEADSLIYRALDTVARLRAHAETHRFDAKRALKIARILETCVEMEAASIRRLAQPHASMLSYTLGEWQSAIDVLLRDEPDRFVTPRVCVGMGG